MTTDNLLSLIEMTATTAERTKFYAVYDRAVALHGRDRAAKIASAAINVQALQSRPQVWG